MLTPSVILYAAKTRNIIFSSGSGRTDVMTKAPTPIAHAAPATHSMAAVLAMVTGTASFVFADAMMKLTSGQFPVGQSIFVRGLFGLALLQSFMMVRGEKVDWMQTFRSEQTTKRSVFEVGATFLYIASLRGLSLPIANAIIQTSPLLVTVGAALFLGERVSWRRAMGTVGGFAGVIMIVQPGATPLTWSLALVLGAVLCSALRDIVTRGIAKVSTLQVVASATFATAAFGGLFSLAEQWQMPASRDLLLWLFSAAFVLAGQALITFAVRSGDVSRVMPFRYTGLVWSLILGVVIWQHMPNGLSMAGMGVIAAAGLFSLREKTPNVTVGQHGTPVMDKPNLPGRAAQQEGR
jgi:drug/metabolite transporter (DMT)-like permease